MADMVFRLVLLLLLLAWSGNFVRRLATGVIDAWKVGRFGVRPWPKRDVRVVRSHAHPVEFWFTMMFWHVMLVVFVIVFLFGIYGMWRVLVPQSSHREPTGKITTLHQTGATTVLAIRTALPPG